MNIEINKPYSVSNRWKKTFVESTFFSNAEEEEVEKIIIWRSGTFIITPRSQAEVDVLTMAQTEDYELSTILTDFEDFEYDCTYDGVSEDYYSDEIENIDGLVEQFYEDEELSDEYFSFSDYIEDGLGFELDENCVLIEGSIVVEEFLGYGDE